MNVKILEYLSARALLNTTAYLGTGSGAALTVGTSARITGDIGVKGSLPVGDDWRFSASLDMSYGPVYSLLLANGLVDAAERSLQRSTLSAVHHRLRHGIPDHQHGDLAGRAPGSWAPTPYLGFTAEHVSSSPRPRPATPPSPRTAWSSRGRGSSTSCRSSSGFRSE